MPAPRWGLRIVFPLFCLCCFFCFVVLAFSVFLCFLFPLCFLFVLCLLFWGVCVFVPFLFSCCSFLSCLVVSLVLFFPWGLGWVG